MSDFPGIFEILANDHSDARTASRKALSLAEVRVDTRIGKFLASATNGPEFDARFSLVQDEFEGIIKGASSEVGHDNPAAIAKALHESYRTHAENWIKKVTEKKDFDKGGLHRATDTPEDEKIPESKIENLEEHGTENQKEKAQFAENVKKGAKGKPPWLTDDDDDDADDDDEGESKESRFLVEAGPSLTRQHYNLIADAVKNAPGAGPELANHFADRMEGTNPNFNRDRFLRAATPDSEEKESKVATEGWGPGHYVDTPEAMAGEEEPWGEQPPTCPQCGGPGVPLGQLGQRSHFRCRNCGFDFSEHPDDVSGHRASTGRWSKVKVADDGNTDLDGPEPKMDKQRWTPQSVKPIDTEESDSRWPTEQIKVTEPLEKKNDGPPGDANSLKGIGEKTTEQVTLPTGEGMDDGGFADGGVDKGPHTDTWGNDGQTEPVKSESLEGKSDAS